MAEIRQPGVGSHWASGSPVVMDGEQSHPGLSPLVDQYTDEVLRAELGLSAADLAALKESGVIRTHDVTPLIDPAPGRTLLILGESNGIRHSRATTQSTTRDKNNRPNEGS
jgi:hypothetical protein